MSSFVAKKLGEIHDSEEGSEKASTKFLVVDREALRQKKDLYIRHSGFETDRVRIDIADFDLVKYLEEKYPEVAAAPTVIGIAKHLCGGATDLALTSY